MKTQQLKEVYERYKHLDKLLIDENWGGENDLQFQILTDLWKAVKNEAEVIPVAKGEGK